jgi:hypothetical protein
MIDDATMSAMAPTRPIRGGPAARAPLIRDTPQEAGEKGVQLMHYHPLIPRVLAAHRMLL